MLYVTDFRNVLNFAFLNSLVIQTTKTYEIDKVTKIKRITKTSIVDARNPFILLVSTTNMQRTNNLYVKIQSKVDYCYSNKSTLQLFVCVVGHDYIRSKEFYVYYFNIYHKLPNIVKAIDTCFKIIHVFSLKYPKECMLV